MKNKQNQHNQSKVHVAEYLHRVVAILCTIPAAISACGSTAATATTTRRWLLLSHKWNRPFLIVYIGMLCHLSYLPTLAATELTYSMQTKIFRDSFR